MYLIFSGFFLGGEQRAQSKLCPVELMLSVKRFYYFVGWSSTDIPVYLFGIAHVFSCTLKSSDFLLWGVIPGVSSLYWARVRPLIFLIYKCVSG